MTDTGWLIVSGGILVLTVVIGIVGLWIMLKEKRSGFAISDERSQQLNWKSAYYAMYMYQYFILTFLFFNIFGREFFGMGEIEAGYPMIAALLVSVISFVIIRRYIDR